MSKDNQWYLYYNSTQQGPYQFEELEKMLNEGDLTLQVHAWRPGLKKWTRLIQLDEFSEDSNPKSGGSHAHPVFSSNNPPKEERGSPRKPLVANIIMTEGKDVFLGICRDISLGGMQVLTSEVPPESGKEMKINVSPSERDPIESFVATGVVVRALDEGRGFSFRFTQLTKDAKDVIEAYLA